MSSRIGGLSSELPHITTTMTMQQYCLRWNNHQPNFISVFSSLLNSESLVDVTLAAEGRHLQAHKVVLSACSSYFQTLLTINPCQHPIVILKDVKFADLKVMVDFMYYGEVNVSQEQLPHILKTAEMLKIKGLAEIPVDQSISKSQCNPGDRAELLTSADAAWSAEIPRQSLSPSPCPLSPGSKRKRLRKSSTGSGSGSMERVSEEHHQSGEITLTSSAGGATSAVGTVIKSDSGNNYPPESNSSVLHKTKQHCSSDTEQQRGPSHESVEADVSHQVTLQVPPEINVQQQHNLETTSSIEIAGPSTSSSQMTMSGIQWNVLDHSAYAHYTTSSCSSPAALSNNNNSNNNNNNSNSAYTQCPPSNLNQTINTTPPPPPNNPNTNTNNNPNSNSNYHHHHHHHHSTHQLTGSPPQMMQKRKRSINPQGDENFIRALEAVRFGGIGFCKAARMYGVNNRTLWLEYKKRGYPNFRLSIKNRKQDSQSSSDNSSQQPPTPQPQHHQQQQQPPPQQQQQQQHQQQLTSNRSAQQQQSGEQSSVKQESQNEPLMNAQNHPVALISGAFFDGKHVDLGAVLQRPKYLDAATIVNAPQAINFQGINFEQM